MEDLLSKGAHAWEFRLLLAGGLSSWAFSIGLLVYPSDMVSDFPQSEWSKGRQQKPSFGNHTQSLPRGSLVTQVSLTQYGRGLVHRSWIPRGGDYLGLFWRLATIIFCAWFLCENPLSFSLQKSPSRLTLSCSFWNPTGTSTQEWYTPFGPPLPFPASHPSYILFTP